VSLFDPNPQSGRSFFLASSDRSITAPQINRLCRAPVAQLDRASDYGFKKGGSAVFRCVAHLRGLLAAVSCL
jgi:hypothetical protein